MAIDVGRGRSAASIVFLLTRVEAAEDKACEKLIARPDRPAGALLADKACDRRLGGDWRGHRIKGGQPPPKSSHEAHIFLDKKSLRGEDHGKR